MSVLGCGWSLGLLRKKDRKGPNVDLVPLGGQLTLGALSQKLASVQLHASRRDHHSTSVWPPLSQLSWSFNASNSIEYIIWTLAHLIEGH